MLQYDLIIKGGTVATASDTFASDIGVKDGRIVALAENLEGATQVVDAAGKLVLPGGIESHCHIEQESASGGMTADDYYSGSVSAAFGGNTTFIPFAAQHRGQTIADVLNLYHDRAGPKSVIDYSYHLIVTDPTERGNSTRSIPTKTTSRPSWRTRRWSPTPMPGRRTRTVSR